MSAFTEQYEAELAQVNQAAMRLIGVNAQRYMPLRCFKRSEFNDNTEIGRQRQRQLMEYCRTLGCNIAVCDPELARNASYTADVTPFMMFLLR
jgi:hypothetical protein